MKSKVLNVLHVLAVLALGLFLALCLMVLMTTIAAHASGPTTITRFTLTTLPFNRPDTKTVNVLRPGDKAVLTTALSYADADKEGVRVDIFYDPRLISFQYGTMQGGNGLGDAPEGVGGDISAFYSFISHTSPTFIEIGYKVLRCPAVRPSTITLRAVTNSGDTATITVPCVQRKWHLPLIRR